MRYDGRTWSDLGNPLGDRDAGSQVHSLIDFGGALHVGSWPLGKVSRYEEEAGTWTDLGRMGDSTEVNGLAAYNGKLYAGALPRAEVFRYDESDGWRSLRRFHDPDGWQPVLVAEMERPPVGDLRMREWARVTSLAEHEGLLFGTVASCTSSVIDAPADIRGTVHAMRAGAVATTSDSLEPGRHHIAAVRAGSRATVFIDGTVAASVDRPGLWLPPTPVSLVTGMGSLARTISGFEVLARAIDARELADLVDRPSR
jgi:hypothetical protein